MKSDVFKFSARLIPKIPSVDSYVFMELFIPFLFGMGLFTSLGIAIGTLFDIVRKVTESGLSISIALQILMLKMPEFVVLAFPMSILLATLMGYSRLASDSELIAFRSIGISPYRLLVPSLILSLMVTGTTFFFSDYVAPQATQQAKSILADALKQDKPLQVEDNIIYPEYKKITQDNGRDQTILTRLFYAEKFDGQQMQGLTILDRSQPGVNQIVTSQSAIWNVDQNSWDFYNGTIYLIAPDGSYRNIVRFEHQQLDLPRAPLDIAKRKQNPADMSIAEAKEYLKIVKLSKNDQRARKVEVRIQEKYALPFVCIVFGLIGSAIGLKPQNTNKATSFGVCIVLIFSYYLLSFITSSMGIWGIVTPTVSAWLPNILGLLAAMSLLVQTAK
ncbi:LptF/LptG family permease [Gloeothece verrucosa]|uniref:Permease YjgP/YjgQ family protein n=1 Tax=Gloeothece verrucosa (strain PCC 7822) TaxID=497965 RepID=E0UID7_GLOV7|nr:LptF/LptG family permease [Gloeothece verrucosa]ADN16905.1 permease YjgP/YjgQ family protein [Gloeothece verrucosa PCC 7822]